MELALDMLTKFQLKSSSTGIDFGIRNVKCIKLKKEGNKVVLDEIFMLDLAQSNDEFPQNRHAAEKLSAFVEVNGLVNEKVRVSPSNSHIKSIDFNLSKMPKKQLSMVILKNLQDILGCEPSNISFDYNLVGEGDENLVRVYYSTLSNVVESLDALEASKLRPANMSASYLAAAEMLDFNNYTESDKAYILVDIGESATSTSLLLGHEVIANNSDTVGFGWINEKLMESIECSYEEAESTKQFLNNLKAIGNREAENIIENAYISILTEVQATIDYFKDQDLGVPISEILLIGGGSSEASANQLNMHNNIKTTLVNPFRNIQTLKDGSDEAATNSINSLAPFMGPAVGLALQGVDW